MKVDNFELEQAVCPAKYQLRIIHGFVPIRKKISLSFGTVIHVGLAEWYRTGDAQKSLKAILDHWPEVMPSDDYRNREYALKVMASYIQRYPKENWTLMQGADGPIIEKAFTLPTGLFLTCANSFPEQENDCRVTDYSGENDYREGHCSNCGGALEEIDYGGILDLPVEAWETPYAVDHKTTTKLGEKDSSYYFAQYKPDNQMTGYIWGLGRLTGRRVGGAMINAIGLYSSGKVLFKRQLTARNDFEIQEWLRGVLDRCNDIRTWQRTGFYRLETSRCTDYGLCDYHNVHILGDPVSRQRRLEQDYVEAKWNYESRDD